VAQGNVRPETLAQGRSIREAGYEAMITPSAVGDFNNLVVFVDRLTGSSRVELEETKPLNLP